MQSRTFTERHTNTEKEHLPSILRRVVRTIGRIWTAQARAISAVLRRFLFYALVLDIFAYPLLDISYTIELRDTGFFGFALPESQIKPTCEENIEGVRKVYDHVRPGGRPCFNDICEATLANSECKYDETTNTVNCACKEGYTFQNNQCTDGKRKSIKRDDYQNSCMDNIFLYIKSTCLYITIFPRLYSIVIISTSRFIYSNTINPSLNFWS